MKIHLYKYQGAGNDFIIIDNRTIRHSLSAEQIRYLCDRRLGVGSDGLMLLCNSPRHDFLMRFYNPDGGEAPMCGNGARCIAAFAFHMGIDVKEFEASDGIHRVTFLKKTKRECTIRLKMSDVEQCTPCGVNSYSLNTGTPHYVEFVEDLSNYPLYERGRYWRYHFEGGTNVNFVEPKNGIIYIRTYERGVEAETLACGTGAVASAIAAYVKGIKPSESKMVRVPQQKNDDSKEKRVPSAESHSGRYLRYDVKARGGELVVEFIAIGDGTFREIYLTGEATFCFECDIDLPRRR